MSKVKKICQECGKEFDGELWAEKRGWDKYCSRDCKGKAQSKENVGQNSHNWKGGKIKKICKECRREFEVYPYRLEKGGGIFCSKMCSNKANGKIFVGKSHHSWKGGKVKKICQECGNEFEVELNQIERGGGKYCSKVCHGKAQSKINVGENHPNWKTKIKRICQECGNEFKLIPSLIEHGHGKYCSMVCYGLARSKLYSGENNPRWTGKINKICELCGKEFAEYESKIKAGRKYCSTECMGKAQSLIRVGENSSRWQGGASFQPYCEKFNTDLKERVRSFFSRQCVLCGMTEKENGEKLNVHHIFIEKMACCESKIEEMDILRKRLPSDVARFGENEFSDLEMTYIRMMAPLCKSCHGKSHGKHNEVKYREIFSDLIMKKYNGKCYYSKEEFAKLFCSFENK